MGEDSLKKTDSMYLEFSLDCGVGTAIKVITISLKAGAEKEHFINFTIPLEFSCVITTRNYNGYSNVDEWQPSSPPYDNPLRMNVHT
jgi:hypothetical protein